MHQDGHSPINIAGGILLLMEPCDITLNRLTEPVSANPILSLVFNEIAFNHDNLIPKPGRNGQHLLNRARIMFQMGAPNYDSAQ